MKNNDKASATEFILPKSHRPDCVLTTYDFEKRKGEIADILATSDEASIQYALEQAGYSPEEQEIILEDNKPIDADVLRRRLGLNAFLLEAANVSKEKIRAILPDQRGCQPTSRKVRSIAAEYNRGNLLESLAVVDAHLASEEQKDNVASRERYEEIRLVVSDYFRKRSENAIFLNHDIYEKMEEALRERFVKLARFFTNQGHVDAEAKKKEIDNLQNFQLEDSSAYYMDRDHWLGINSGVARTSLENDKQGKIDVLVMMWELDESRQASLLGLDITVGGIDTLRIKLNRNLLRLRGEQPPSLLEATIIDDVVVEKGQLVTPLIFCTDRDGRDDINKQLWDECSSDSESMVIGRAPYAYMFLEEAVLQLEYYKRHNITLDGLDELLEIIVDRRIQFENFLQKNGKNPDSILKKDKSFRELKKLLRDTPEKIKTDYEKQKGNVKAEA